MIDQVSRLTAALTGRYVIEKELGAGGMATVYLARDVRHERRVALKVLRPELAAVIGAERFLLEIRTTANLQHPHILPLFDSGEADSFLYYVMPYIEGESLRDRLSREKQLGVSETVDLIRGVASALDHAHRHGVIHRDIKPENILLHDGQALVADFGISLAVSQAGSGTRLTETGMSLGTPHYMSPEQATGDRALDARSDIYSLGCVAYEMLTGDPPHTGSTAQAIVARVLSEDAAPVTRTRASVPIHVDHAIRCSLSKTPADRFGRAAEFAAALATPSYRMPGAGSTGAPGDTRYGKAIGVWAVTATVMLAGLSLWMWRGRETPAPAVERQRILLGEQLFEIPVAHFATISADGTTLIFPDSVAGRRMLWRKRRGDLDPVAIPGTDGAIHGVLSPDGRTLAFVREDSTLRTIPVEGGPSVELARPVNLIAGFAWLDGGTLIASRPGFLLMRVPAGGGNAVPLPPSDGGGAIDIQPLPNGRGALIGRCRESCAEVSVAVFDAAKDSVTPLVPGASKAWYLATGHLLLAYQDGTAAVAPFDLARLEVTGPAIPVLDGIRVLFGVPDLAVSPASGTVLYGRGNADPQSGGWSPAWVTREGVATAVDSAWQVVPAGNAGLAISPDGTRLAVAVRSGEGDHIYVKQLDRGPLQRLTLEGPQNFRPSWTPDGRSLTYLSNRKDSARSFDVLEQRADGSDSARVLLDLDVPVAEAVWAPDGASLILRIGGVRAGSMDLAIFRPGRDSVPVPLVADSRFNTKGPALSADGRWLAYESTESGREEIFVRPFPNVADAKLQISTAGGLSPIFAHHRNELYYLNGALELVAVPFTVERGVFRPGTPRILFETGQRFMRRPNTRMYDIDPSDDRFLFLGRIGRRSVASRESLVLISNLLPEIQAKLAEAR